MSRFGNLGINAHPSKDASVDIASLSILAKIANLRILRLKCTVPSRNDWPVKNQSESYGSKFRKSYGELTSNVWFCIQAQRKRMEFGQSSKSISYIPSIIDLRWELESLPLILSGPVKGTIVPTKSWSMEACQARQGSPVDLEDGSDRLEGTISSSQFPHPGIQKVLRPANG